MNKLEKTRLTILAQEAASSIEVDRPRIRERASRIAGKFSPMNNERFRELAEVVWWLAAIGADDDAIRVSDALCEVDDRPYWMFEALGCVFAARAFLHRRAGRIGQAEADGRSARDWLKRDPNYKPLRKKDAEDVLGRVRGWLERAAAERSHLDAIQVLARALSVLVFYQQLALCQVPAAMVIPAADYDRRVRTTLDELQARIEVWNAV